MKADLVEAEGMIHAINIVSGGEYTLCGDAFDLASDIDGYEWSKPTRRTVDCPSCRKIILSLRHIRC